MINKLSLSLFVLFLTFSLEVFSKINRNLTNYSVLLDSPVVISLERHRFRYEETKRLMELAGFSNIQLFDAVDGFYTDEQVFSELNILEGRRGQKGCAASHLLVWHKFFEDPEAEDYLFVCEDDMLPHSGFKELFPFYWSKTPSDFDIVMVGNQLGDMDEKTFQRKDYISLTPTFCLHAYIISRKGAERLYNLYMKLPSDSESKFVIDIFLIHAMINKQINFYCYDGRFFPDAINQKKGMAWRDSGICFQNTSLGSSIHLPEIVLENEPSSPK